ncbi:MAG: V-type ATPase subunit [Anaerovoracaceae bacterium]
MSIKIKKKPLDYTFANGFIGAQHKNLMSKQDLIRAYSSKELSGVESVLQEFGYGNKIFEDRIEFFIRREQNKLFDLVFHTLSDTTELGMFLFPFDYHNIKVFLKAEFLGITPDDNYLLSTSFIEAKKMEVMVRERNYILMTKNMREAIIETVDLFNRSHDPQVIDLVLDKYCYKDMIKGAVRTEDEFLIEYMKLDIDLLNLNSFVRLRNINKSWAFFQKIFLEGGHIDENFFVSNYEEPYQSLGDKVAPYGFRDLIVEGAGFVDTNNDFSIFEKIKSNLKMDFIKKAKYETFGIAPIAAFWLAKEAEIDNVRIVLAGRLAGLPVEAISERLRDTYV